MSFSTSDNSYDDRANDAAYLTSANYFTVYKLEANVVNGADVSIEGDNVQLTPTNLLPFQKDANGDPLYDENGNMLLDTAYNFDPSKYVFEQTTTGYKLAPISSYNLNNGKGKKVEQLNHIVKMAQATSSSFKFEIGWDLGGIEDWLNQYVSTESGGVVSAEIGTTKKYYAIPAGMIAFYIDEEVTNDDNPSYINIIVAVNPEDRRDNKIGLWNTANFGTSNNVNFDLSKPDQSFMLPKSITGSSTEDATHIITVSEYVTQKFNADGTPYLDENSKPVYESSGTTSYVYLGGEVAFVYHSFQVTKGGIYLLGSCAGPLSVSYFSVSGAAGQGADGTSTSPLGKIDFVYANGGNIITVNQGFGGIHDTNNEDHAYYYPSYHFVVMEPVLDTSGNVTTPTQNEKIKIYRYVVADNTTAAGRRLKIIGCSNAKPKGLAGIYQDTLETTE